MTPTAKQKTGFGERLQAARVRSGWTLEAVGAALPEKGVKKKTKQAVGHWETEHSSPDALTLMALCALYDASADELLFGAPASRPSPWDALGSDLAALVAKLGRVQLTRLRQTIQSRIAELIEDQADNDGSGVSTRARQGRTLSNLQQMATGPAREIRSHSNENDMGAMNATSEDNKLPGAGSKPEPSGDSGKLA